MYEHGKRTCKAGKNFVIIVKWENLRASCHWRRIANKQKISTSLCDLLKLIEIRYNLRGDEILTLAKVNTTKYGLKSISYQGAKLWNALPNEHIKISNYKLFKKSVLRMELTCRCS